MMVILKTRTLYLMSTDHVNFERTLKQQHQMSQLTEGNITTFHVYQPTNSIVFTSEKNEK